MQRFGYNECMLWVRKGLVHLLSLLLFACLIGAAVATSININLSHPDKIKTWLNQSRVYDHFVAEAIAQAQKSAGNKPDNGPVSLSDSAVQQAAESAFSQQLLHQSVNTVLDSNYAWLQGKTATPNFTVDLRSAKHSFAEQVGAYVRTHLAGLPVCTPAQLSQIDVPNIDPLTVVCRPDALSPEAEGNQVTQSIENGDFLSNPLITSSSINPNAAAASKPYYTKLSFAPELYRSGVKLPWALGLVAMVLALSIIVVAPFRRKGWHRVGSMLAGAGVLLIIGKFIADFALRKVESKAFNNADVGQLQQSLAAFARHVESAIVKIDLYFGLLYVVLAAAVFISLYRTRNAGAPAVASGVAAQKVAESVAGKPNPAKSPKSPKPLKPKPTGSKSKPGKSSDLVQ